MNEESKIIAMSSHRPPGGGDGNGYDARMRNVENKISAIEAKLSYLATREDIQSIKAFISERETVQTRWLVGVVLAAVAALFVAVIRVFLV